MILYRVESISSLLRSTLFKGDNHIHIVGTVWYLLPTQQLLSPLSVWIHACRLELNSHKQFIIGSHALPWPAYIYVMAFGSHVLNAMSLYMERVCYKTVTFLHQVSSISLRVWQCMESRESERGWKRVREGSGRGREWEGEPGRGQGDGDKKKGGAEERDKPGITEL